MTEAPNQQSQSQRAETGPLHFENDWPGLFIRGDNALMRYAPALRALLNGNANPIEKAQCNGLLNLLEQTKVGDQEAQQAVLVNQEVISKKKSKK